MDRFRTTIPLPANNLSIDYQDKILCIGSCFTENIGQRLVQYKFPTILNPFGILYNPLSISRSLEILLSEDSYQPNDLIFHNDLWHSMDHHGSFSNPDQNTTLTNINTTLLKAKQFLQSTNRLILTFGTANVFIHKSTNKIVANCHKISNKEFERRKISVTTITEALLPVLKKLKTEIPKLEVILTVSPVRHIRDGLIENQRSKGTLLLAIEGITQSNSFVHYFPSYELMMDDLRDYRFFEKDMVHPNEIAIDYIWEYFQKSYFSTATKDILNQVQKIVAASQHRPFHSQTDAHQHFLRKQLEKIERLSQQFPFLQLRQEQEIFQAQLV